MPANALANLEYAVLVQRRMGDENHPVMVRQPLRMPLEFGNILVDMRRKPSALPLAIPPEPPDLPHAQIDTASIVEQSAVR